MGLLHFLQQPQILCFRIRIEPDNAFGLAFEDGTQLFQGKHGDGFVVLQIVNCPGIDAMLADEGIGGDPFLLHGFP